MVFEFAINQILFLKLPATPEGADSID